MHSIGFSIRHIIPICTYLRMNMMHLITISIMVSGKDVLKDINGLISNISIAMFIQIGDWDVFLDELIYIQDIIRDVPNIYEYISIIDTIHNTDEEIYDMLGSRRDLTSIIRMKNRGFDIGGFFYGLQDAKQKNHQHDIAIKIHTKTDRIWRNRLLKTLRDIKNVVRTFYVQKNVGMICASHERYLLRENVGNIPSAPSEEISSLQDYGSTRDFCRF